MKSDTSSYIHLQNLYKRQAEHEKNIFKDLIGKEIHVDDETVDEFVKNAHALRVLHGKQFGAIDANRDSLGGLSYLRIGEKVLTGRGTK